jgi:phosphocarrier protein
VTGGEVEVSTHVSVTNRYGLHARPAAEFVKLASRFRSEVWVEKDGLEVNGKSIMGVLMLAAESGSTLRLRVVGDDAEAALEALAHLIERGLSESELDDFSSTDRKLGP